MRTSATLLERLARVSRAAFGIVAALGAAAIWGWVLGVPALRDLGADFAPMSPAAALALVLLATSFFAAERGRPRSARVAAALAATIGVLTLAETLAGLPIGMSFHWLAPGGGEMPARLSIAACITLILLALVTPLERERLVFRAPATSVVAAIVGAVAFFALLGLSLRVLRFDIAAPLLGFSAPAAVATMLAAIGLAAARPSEWLLDTLASKRTGAVVTRWLLPAAFVVPIAVGWMRLYAEREGLFGEAFGMALFTLVMIAWFSSLILWVARTLDQAAAQRAQAEGAATEQREWLQVTLASIGDGVIATDASGRVRFLNAAAQRLTGWRAAEAAGRPLDELLALYDERDGKSLRNPLNAALQTRAAAAAGGEPAVRARDGAVHPVSANAAPILDGDGLLGAVLVLREVSAQRQSERAMREAYTELDQRVVRRTAALERASAALRERNALLNAITTSTPDLIFAKDRQGRLLMANPAWSRAVGKSAEEAASLDDNERLVLEAGETMIVEELLNTPAGERTYLTTKSPLRDEQGRVIGLIGVATDITERKHAQRELEKLVVAEQRLRAEAERANRAKDEFLAIVSHELRSPLNALRGWSHLLATTRPLDGVLVERASKAIKRNVDHQTRLIDDLLDTSRIVSGKLTIERRVVNLVDTVHAALDAARPVAQAKHIELRFAPADPATMVIGDAGRLQQLVSNLLSNAVKFTPEQGAVSVILHKSGERVQLQVKDNGIGIAPAFLPHVFDRFTQADTSAARRAGGLGIGLALVRHIALLHGGQVRADSAGPGRGATFTVDLPGAPASAVAALARLPSGDRRRSTAGALKGVSVWVTDDDVDAHEVLALTLRQAGAEVECFNSGRSLGAALEGLQPGQGPHVLLIDLAMPGEDGFEALRRARAIELARGNERYTPALALTAFTQIERERLTAAGFVDRVDKPVDAEKLITAIRAALRTEQRSRAAV
ncbi:MAG: PAS domain S-box protein [Betaproteobacteria bacterium]|nr:MAG: PAS domain S-box protein [Betaproteobacteria bacterium]